MTTASSAADGQNPPPGLIISATEHVRRFLSSASHDPDLPEQLRNLASELSSLTNLPYKSLREIWIASRPEARPGWARLLSGSHFVFTSPKPREKSEELKVRLRKLSVMAEKKEYEELVKDIIPKKDTNEPFSSYKDQLGFGNDHLCISLDLNEWGSRQRDSRLILELKDMMAVQSSDVAIQLPLFTCFLLTVLVLFCI